MVPVSAIATAHVVTTPSRASSAATSSGGSSKTGPGSSADHSAGNPRGTPIRPAPRAATASAMTWATSAASHRRTVAR